MRGLVVIAGSVPAGFVQPDRILAEAGNLWAVERAADPDPAGSCARDGYRSCTGKHHHEA